MMTVIEMAREAGPLISTPFDVWCERFVELVRADEREVCAKAIEDLLPDADRGDCAATIRART